MAGNCLAADLAGSRALRSVKVIVVIVRVLRLVVVTLLFFGPDFYRFSLAVVVNLLIH